MITHLEGKLVEKNPTNVVIDCHGVGYFVNIIRCVVDDSINCIS